MRNGPDEKLRRRGEMLGRAATLVIIFLIAAPLAVGAIYVVVYLFAHAFMAAGVVADWQAARRAPGRVARDHGR